MEDPSVDISITYVGLILTKPTYQLTISFLGIRKLGVRTQFNFVNFELFFFFFFYIFRFPCCSTREDLSIDVSITNVGLMLTKLR